MNLTNNVNQVSLLIDKAKNWLKSLGSENEPEFSERDTLRAVVAPSERSGLDSTAGPSRESLDRLDEEGPEPPYSFEEEEPVLLLDEEEDRDSLPLGDELAQRMLKQATGDDSDDDEPLRARY